MKMKRIVSALLAVLFTLSLCGCQLAQKNAGEVSATAHIIGLIITTEYLDLFDSEAYLEDHIVGVTNGEVILSENSDRYNGRLYATLQATTSTNPDSQEKLYQYVFTGIEGFAFYSANHPESVPMENFLASCYDSAVSDIYTNISITDAGESVELEGTIYLVTSQANKPLFLNRVYQTQDGSVYVESGDSFEGGGEIVEGPFMTHTISDTTTTTGNGVTENNGNSIELSIAFLNPPTKIVVIQMDQNSAIVSRTEYEPGKLPETIVPEASTEYIILETQKVDPEGAHLVTRELFTKDDEALDSFYERADGICVKQYTQISW